MSDSRKKLALLWIAGGFASAAVGIALSILYRSTTHADGQLDIVREILASSAALPLGWLFYTIVPISLPSSLASWASIASFVWACKARRRELLYISYAANLIFGFTWPKAFWAMMSV